jgi:hypothetical protein
MLPSEPPSVSIRDFYSFKTGVAKFHLVLMVCGVIAKSIRSKTQRRETVTSCFASRFTEFLDPDRDAPALGAGTDSGALLTLLRKALFPLIQPFVNFWSALPLASDPIHS